MQNEVPNLGYLERGEQKGCLISDKTRTLLFDNLDIYVVPSTNE